jgi:hypothetical protein
MWEESIKSGVEEWKDQVIQKSNKTQRKNDEDQPGHKNNPSEAKYTIKKNVEHAQLPKKTQFKQSDEKNTPLQEAHLNQIKSEPTCFDTKGSQEKNSDSPQKTHFDNQQSNGPKKHVVTWETRLAPSFLN